MLILVNAVDDLSDIQITLVGDDRFRVVVIFFLNGFNVLFNVVFGCFIKTELLNDLFVALKDLDRVPTLLFLGQLMNAGFLNMSDSVFYRALKGVFGNRFFVLGSLDRGFCRLLNALVFQRGDLDDRTAKCAAFSAEISTTVQPSARLNSLVLILTPVFSTTSIILIATTTGIPSSQS